MTEPAMTAGTNMPMIRNGLLLNHPTMITTWLSKRVMAGELFEVLGVGVGIVKPGVADRIVKPDEVIELAAAAYFFEQHTRGGMSDISICAAADDMTAVTPEMIKAILLVPFGEMGMRRITAFIDGRNLPAILMMQRFGFVCEGAKRAMRDDGGEVLMFGLLEKECPYLHPAPETYQIGQTNAALIASAA
jgi:hypothetical protein